MTQIKGLGTRKLTPEDSDFIPIQEESGVTRHISRGDFLQGVGTGQSAWTGVSTSQILAINSKTIVTASNQMTLTLPSGLLGEIEIFNLSNNRIGINLDGGKYRGVGYSSSQIQLSGLNTYTRLIWINSSIGWYPITGDLELIGNYPSGMRFWLEGGSLSDRSGNNYSVTPINASSPPNKALGLDNKFVLRWNGSATQELQVTPFLAGTTSATLYAVYSVASNNHYGIVRTANLEDFWYFNQNNAGYFGVFRSSRFEAYPLNMPSFGNALVSIHANTTQQEIIVNNSARGIQTSTYSPGDRFRIGVNNRNFNGDIALILVYPYFINKTSQEHQLILSSIKSFYPSLPFTL
jgi:hypothetical protein